MTPEQIAKLPKMTQTHIQNLEHTIENKNALIAGMVTDGGEVSWESSLEYQEPHGIPKYSTVRFKLDDKGNYIDCMIRRDAQAIGGFTAEKQDSVRVLEVRVGGHHLHRLVAMPQAANTLHITASY